MFKDPIVEEVRAARWCHAAKFNNDLDAIVADLKKREKNLGRPVVSLAPKKLIRKADHHTCCLGTDDPGSKGIIRATHLGPCSHRLLSGNGLRALRDEEI